MLDTRQELFPEEDVAVVRRYDCGCAVKKVLRIDEPSAEILRWCEEAKTRKDWRDFYYEQCVEICANPSRYTRRDELLVTQRLARAANRLAQHYLKQEGVRHYEEMRENVYERLYPLIHIHRKERVWPI